MSKTKTTLPMKGLRTPRIFLWFHGFFHGKILRTGGLDPETGTITSGYITGQIKRFRNVCVARREYAEENLKKEWADADRLLIDLASISAALADTNDYQKLANMSSAQARAQEKAASARASREAERLAILKHLVDISNAIRSEFDHAHDQMEATAEMMLSTFSCYGHGLMMQPVYTRNLPTVSYDDCAAQILNSHEAIWNTINSILKEVKSNEHL